jgi:hypothetical protein
MKEFQIKDEGERAPSALTWLARSARRRRLMESLGAAAALPGRVDRPSLFPQCVTGKRAAAAGDARQP